MTMDDFSYEHLGVCYWNGSMGPFVIGVIGSGPGLQVLIDIVYTEVFRDFLPDMVLVGASHISDVKSLDILAEINIPVFDTFEEMLERNPDINLVVEMLGSADLLARLRQVLPNHVSLLDHRELVFFCGLHDMAAVKGHYKENLAHQRTLLQSIIDEIREDIFLLDKSGQVVDLNRIVWQRAGIPRKELLGKPCWHAARLRDGSAFCDQLDPVCPFHKTLQSGQKEESLVTRVNRDGLLQYYRLYAYPILDMRGNMTHIMVMHRDITKRTYEEKHQNQRDKLAIIGEMSTYLAHEIRNPLFAIGGFANSLFKSPSLSDRDREKAAILVEETRRIDRMLTSMLNFVRPSEAVSDEVDLLALARSAAELMTIGYGAQGYRIDVQATPPLPTVLGDEDALKRCVVNLIKNGIEAMPGGGTVTLDLGLSGDYVVLKVIDNGIGMNEHEQDRVFNPFFSTKEDGSGLGMAMIKKIIEEHGGKVKLASRLGEGTTVSLLLPPALDVEAAYGGA
jgi:PAS domain S-box-containing protein